MLCIFGSLNNCLPLIVEVSLPTVDLFKSKDKQNNARPDRVSIIMFFLPFCSVAGHWLVVVKTWELSCQVLPIEWSDLLSVFVFYKFFSPLLVIWSYKWSLVHGCHACPALECGTPLLLQCKPHMSSCCSCRIPLSIAQARSLHICVCTFIGSIYVSTSL